MDALDRLEADSVYILREAFHAFRRPALLWSLGKDSGALLWLTRKAFLGRVPFPVFHVDTGKKFPEMYAYRTQIAAAWNLDLIVGTCPPVETIDPTLPPAARSADRKTAGLKAMLAEHRFDALIVGIRGDEEATRAKERVFSPRNDQGAWDIKDQPPEFGDLFNTTVAPGGHVRVHPLLQWTELDIWRYVRREAIPVVDLYFARGGRRYRSLGDQDITNPIASEAADLDAIIAELERTKIAERSGRAMDHDPIAIIPTVARDGDNLANPSAQMPWYSGGLLTMALDRMALPPAPDTAPLRLPIQDVYKFGDRRVLAGRLESGTLRVGDPLLFSPSNQTARVVSIERWPGPSSEISVSGESIGITLDEPLVVERGELASHTDTAPIESDVFRGRVLWLGSRPIVTGSRYRLRIMTAEVGVRVQRIHYVVDAEDLAERPADRVERNEVAELTLRCDRLIAFDEASSLVRSGRFALIDEHRVGGGGLISMEGYADQRPSVTVRATNVAKVEHRVSSADRVRRNGHSGGVLWFTGLSGAGKSTLALDLERQLFADGYQVFVLDGDNLRNGLNADLGFSPEERSENIRRVGEVAALMAQAGFVVIASLISPYRSDRDRARRAAAAGFHEIYIRADLATCEARDPKGLYRRARAGEIADFTGVSAPYEEPEAAELTVDTTAQSVGDCVRALRRYVTSAFPRH